MDAVFLHEFYDVVVGVVDGTANFGVGDGPVYAKRLEGSVGYGEHFAYVGRF